MMPAKELTQRRPRWQFSLRWFVAVAILLGSILGIFGPIAVRMIEQLQASPPPPPLVIPASAFDDALPNYYESGETPLD